MPICPNCKNEFVLTKDNVSESEKEEFEKNRKRYKTLKGYIKRYPIYIVVFAGLLVFITIVPPAAASTTYPINQAQLLGFLQGLAIASIWVGGYQLYKAFKVKKEFDVRIRREGTYSWYNE